MTSLAHWLKRQDGNWFCMLCSQRFHSRPDQENHCPGVCVYPRQGPRRPAYLKTWQVLYRAGMQPDCSRPAGAYLLRSAGGAPQWHYLYDEREATRREISPGVMARIQQTERLKAQRYTCQGCGSLKKHPLWYRQIIDGQCARCRSTGAGTSASVTAGVGEP